MIDKRFLFFRTKSAFERELSLNNINQQSIAFIKDIEAIWTHGTYFHCKCKEDIWVLGDNLPIILSDGWDTQPPQYIKVDRKLSLDSENPVWNKTVTEALNTKVDKSIMPNYYTKSEVDDMCNSVEDSVSALNSKHNADINTLNNKHDVDINSLRDYINNNVSTINNTTSSLQEQIDVNENNISTNSDSISDIDDAIRNIEQEIERLKGQSPSSPTTSDGIKHIILEEVEYEALTEYEDNAIYFVLEPVKKGWVLGNTLPIILR